MTSKIRTHAATWRINWLVPIIIVVVGATTGCQWENDDPAKSGTSITVLPDQIESPQPGDASPPCPADRDIRMAIFGVDLADRGSPLKVWKKCTDAHVAVIGETTTGRLPYFYALLDQRSGSLANISRRVGADDLGSGYYVQTPPWCHTMEMENISREIREFFGCTHWRDRQSGAQPTAQAEEVEASQRQLLISRQDRDSNSSTACPFLTDVDATHRGFPPCRNIARELYDNPSRTQYRHDTIPLEQLRDNSYMFLHVQILEDVGMAFVYAWPQYSPETPAYLSMWRADADGKWRLVMATP